MTSMTRADAFHAGHEDSGQVRTGPHAAGHVYRTLPLTPLHRTLLERQAGKYDTAPTLGTARSDLSSPLAWLTPFGYGM